MTSNAPGTASKPTRPRSPHFPPHNAPRVWFITRGVSPIAIALAKQVLEHGDYVVAGVIPAEFEKSEGQIEDFKAFLEEVKSTERWRERLRVVGLEARIVGQCQAAVAEAVEAFGRIDVLLCAASEGMSYESACLVELIPDALQLSLELLKNWHRAVVPSASLTRSLRSTSSQM
jgi:NAD(P)-dependent dehydrogenase (short-subunit alcohol dehydrogenase family)